MEVLENTKRETKIKLSKIQFADNFFYLCQTGKEFVLVCAATLNNNHWLRKSIAIGKF